MASTHNNSNRNTLKVQRDKLSKAIDLYFQKAARYQALGLKIPNPIAKECFADIREELDMEQTPTIKEVQNKLKAIDNVLQLQEKAEERTLADITNQPPRQGDAVLAQVSPPKCSVAFSR